MTNVKIQSVNSKYWQEYKAFRLKALQDDRHAFGASYENMIKKPDEYWKNQIEGSKENSKKTVLFALFDNKIVGVVIIKFSKYKKLKHVARLSGFYVNPDYRGQGIGKKLFDAALQEISKNKEINKVKLSVNTVQTTAINLYRSYGFKEAGKLEKEFKIDNQYFDVLVMERLLD